MTIKVRPTTTGTVIYTKAEIDDLLSKKADKAAVPPPPSPSGETRFQAYTTGYTYGDNDPPNSAAISYPQIHTLADGTGTYADPITLAVGLNSSGNPIYPPGTKFYIPNVRRYFIVEDMCAACGQGHSGFPWLDMWIDGRGQTNTQSQACANAVTGTFLVIKNPAPNYVAVLGHISSAAGCSNTFGDTVVTV